MKEAVLQFFSQSVQIKNNLFSVKNEQLQNYRKRHMGLLKSCPWNLLLPSPSRRFRPDKEDGAVKIDVELAALLRLASGKANKGVRIAG